MAELLITIAIIGILSAIAIPHYLQNEAAKVSEAVSQLNAINLGEQTYQRSTANYIDCIPDPADAKNDPCWATINVDDPQASNGRAFNYKVVNATATTFCTIATRRIAGASPPTVCLNQKGEYSGTHPNRPTAPAGSGCDPGGACG